MATDKHRALDPWPARWDVAQGVTGLILALFMWAHMFMVSSILLGKDAMYFVSRMFEGEPLLGKPYPILVSLFGAFIFSLVIAHAFLAMRRFPADYSKYRRLHTHLGQLHHGDTRLWYFQVLTGFALFFFASIHLYQIIMHPDAIGPYASSDRIWSGRMWPLYLILLFAVEIHGGVGLYRLAIKWGWFMGSDPRKNRIRLSRLKWALTIFFLTLGLCTLAAYMKIGIEHESLAGERYRPESSLPMPATGQGGH